MANSQSYAIEIEHIMSRVFNCERFGVGGIVNSDCIRKNPYYSMVSTLIYLYANANAKQKKNIINFIKKYIPYKTDSIDSIISAEEKAIKNMIYEFEQICEY